MQQRTSNPLYVPTLDNYVPYGNDGVKFIPTGILGVDNILNDLATKEVTIVTGRTKEGKSTFVHRIALNAIDKGFSVLLVDGEHNQTFLINHLYRMVIGSTPNAYRKVIYNKKSMIVPKDYILVTLNEWHKDKLHIFTKYLADIKSLDEMFEFTRMQARTFKADLIIWDNIMSLVDGTQAEKNENQRKFMQRAAEMAKEENVHCIVVAHPNKESKHEPKMNVYDVAGSSDIVNICTSMIQIMRNFDITDQEPYDGLARVMLNRLYGAVGEFPLKYDQEQRCLFEMNSFGEAIKKELNWMKRGEQTRWQKL